MVLMLVHTQLPLTQVNSLMVSWSMATAPADFGLFKTNGLPLLTALVISGSKGIDAAIGRLMAF
jgi:hypothetical protein